MLTTEDAGPVAGINQVDWDAVAPEPVHGELLPRQESVEENRSTTRWLSLDDLFEKLVKSKNPGAARGICAMPPR